MAKKQPVTKTLRAAPSSASGDTLAQWIKQGQAADPPFSDDLTIQRADDPTTQRPNEPKLRVVSAAEPGEPRKRTSRREESPAKTTPVVAGKSIVSRVFEDLEDLDAAAATWCDGLLRRGWRNAAIDATLEPIAVAS